MLKCMNISVARSAWFARAKDVKPHFLWNEIKPQSNVTKNAAFFVVKEAASGGFYFLNGGEKLKETAT